MHAITPQPRPQAHASTRTYMVVAAVLGVATLIEFGMLYVPALKGVVVPLLLGLSAVKFTLVAMYFMHLKYDSRVFWMFFLPGLFLAAMVTISLFVLMNMGHHASI